MSTGKKILFIPDNSAWGGSELLWSRTALELSSHGINCHILKRPSLEFPIALSTDFNDSGITISIIPPAPDNGILKRFFKKTGLIESQTNLIRKVIHEIAPDLIVFNQGYNFNSIALAEQLYDLDIPFISISHALNENYWPNVVLACRMREFFSYSKHNYFVSECNLNRTANQLSAFPGHASVVRNPVDPKCYSGPLIYPDDLTTFHIAFPGRYDFKSKGQDLILDVLSDNKWQNRSLHLNFYGNGPDHDALCNLVAFKNMKNVTVHGYVTPESIWLHNHALVLTSRFEGLPIVIPEAMMFGRIPIVTDVSGNAELINDNVTGFVARGTSPKAIDEALDRAWNSRASWKEMGFSARNSVLNDYDPKPEVVFAMKLIEYLS